MSDPSPMRRQAPVSRRRRARPRAFDFSLGAALARSFGCFGRHLPVLCLFAFVAFVPLVLYNLAIGEQAYGGATEFERDLRELGFSSYRMSFWDRLAREGAPWSRLLDLGLPLLLQATVTFGVFQYLSGSRVDYARSFGRGMARFLPVLGVALLTGLLAVAVLFVVGLLMAAVLSTLGGGLGAALILLLVASVVVFGIICILFVSIQATVVERIGPAAAMARSAWLTRGARWKVFVIVLIVGGATLLAEVLVHAGLGDNPATWGQARLGILLSAGLAAIFAVFQAVAASVVYHDLRKAKEGVGLDELIRVFD